LTITHVRSNPSVANASLPFPVIIAVEREPGELVIALNSTIWEFTLGEFGSWYWGSEKKTQGGFTNIQYLGTDLDNGTPTNETGGCVLGFSNLGWVVFLAGVFPLLLTLFCRSVRFPSYRTGAGSSPALPPPSSTKPSSPSTRPLLTRSSSRRCRKFSKT
jgi:hypothetical protein